MFATHSSSPFLFVSAATLYSSNTQHDLVSGKHSYKVCSLDQIYPRSALEEQTKTSCRVSYLQLYM